MLNLLLASLSTETKVRDRCYGTTQQGSILVSLLEEEQDFKVTMNLTRVIKRGTWLPTCVN